MSLYNPDEQLIIRLREAQATITALTARLEELEKVPPDNPEADATDAAHPAWWRGHDHGAHSVCQLVNGILDGEPILGTAREPWQATRLRLAALVGRTAELERPTPEVAVYRNGFEAGLEAAAAYVETIGDYGSERRASDIRGLDLPATANFPMASVIVQTQDATPDDVVEMAAKARHQANEKEGHRMPVWETLSPEMRDAKLRIERAVTSAIAPTLRAQGAWQPIETAPKDGTPVHLGFQRMAGFDVVAHWSDGDWSLSGDGRHAERLNGRPPPTHWRPLPAPPAAVRAGGSGG